MSVSEYYHVTSTTRKTYFAEWKSPHPKAIIILIHGLGEHIRRYDDQFNYFNSHHITCLSADLPGHGRSEGPRGVWNTIEDHYAVIDKLVEIAILKYPGLPLILYGHSMGGNIAAGYVIDKRPKINGLILTGSAIKTPKDLPVFIINTVLSAPRFIQNKVMSSGLNLKSLCTDQNIVEKYKTDPLIHDRVSLGAGAVILKNAQNLMQYKVDNNFPVLLMHGENDKICYPSGTKLLQEVFTKKVVLKYWPGMLHEIHNEKNKVQVWNYMIDWMNQL
jgi:acylglycerol lipase